jgi:hypothetical protein
MLKYPSDLRAFIKDKQKRALHPAIRLDIVNNNYDFLITDFPYMFFTEPYSKIKIPKICIVEDTGMRLILIILKRYLSVDLMHFFVGIDKNF